MTFEHNYEYHMEVCTEVRRETREGPIVVDLQIIYRTLLKSTQQHI